MNFMTGSLFHRSTEPEELEITQESGGGVPVSYTHLTLPFCSRMS